MPRRISIRSKHQTRRLPHTCRNHPPGRSIPLERSILPDTCHHHHRNTPWGMYWRSWPRCAERSRPWGRISLEQTTNCLQFVVPPSGILSRRPGPILFADRAVTSPYGSSPGIARVPSRIRFANNALRKHAGKSARLSARSARNPRAG